MEVFGKPFSFPGSLVSQNQFLIETTNFLGFAIQMLNSGENKDVLTILMNYFAYYSSKRETDKFLHSLSNPESVIAELGPKIKSESIVIFDMEHVQDLDKINVKGREVVSAHVTEKDEENSWYYDSENCVELRWEFSENNLNPENIDITTENFTVVIEFKTENASCGLFCLFDQRLGISYKGISLIEGKLSL